jgi:hypothetical protein
MRPARGRTPRGHSPSPSSDVLALPCLVVFGVLFAVLASAFLIWSSEPTYCSEDIIYGDCKKCPNNGRCYRGKLYCDDGYRKEKRECVPDERWSLLQFLCDHWLGAIATVVVLAVAVVIVRNWQTERLIEQHVGCIVQQLQKSSNNEFQYASNFEVLDTHPFHRHWYEIMRRVEGDPSITTLASQQGRLWRAERRYAF